MERDWSWLGPIFEVWGPLGVIAVLLAGGAFFSALTLALAVWRWRRRVLGILGSRDEDRVRTNGEPVERRRGMRELLGEIERLKRDQARLWEAFRVHEVKNEERTALLHKKIESLRNDVEQGFREARASGAAGVESVRQDIRSLAALLGHGTPPGRSRP